MLQTIVVIAMAAAIVALMLVAGVPMSSGSGAENVTPNTPCGCILDNNGYEG